MFVRDLEVVLEYTRELIDWRQMVGLRICFVLMTKPVVFATEAADAIIVFARTRRRISEGL